MRAYVHPMRHDEIAWLLQEHEGLDEQLGELLEALATVPPDRDAVRSWLDMMGSELPAHHEAEEEAVIPWLAQRLPEAIPTLEAIQVEHRKLVEAIDELRALVDSDPSALVEEGERFARRLWQHARAEQALIERALAAGPPAEA